MIDFRQLIDAGLHFGHQKSRWCPKMKPFIWGHRGGVHLIDISKTALALQKTASFLESVASRGESILWVGTKKAAKDVVAQVGSELKMPYVDYRWVGGTITNYQQVKKAVTKLLHYEDILSKAKDDSNVYTKKELVRFSKLAERLRRSVGGLKDLRMPIGAIVLIDVKKEHTAQLEANGAGVPVVALVDSNADPSGIDYIIPGNDDSTKGIKFVLDYLKSAVSKGLANKVNHAKKDEQEKELKDASKAPKAKVAASKKEVKAAPKKKAVASTAKKAAPKTTAKKTEAKK
ncbi:MAG: 30S ribosomal protein S2 [Epsilonproteobacteria bacterium]|nr:30S ribosomal protein S2 [Campylobacterota bacterium]|tara:strand:- start:3875 stop:4741 length:867 start_codon:yes stop_codon:yes gene_type:complete